jgi:2-haloacid dehalogenase
VARGVGDDEATRFLAAEDFDFLAWNHHLDAGRRWADAAAGVDGSHPHWSRHVAAYGEHFPLSITEPIETTVAVLRDLHAAGVPLFALTNWSDELFPHALARHDFLGLFEDIVVSGAEGLAKPDPAIFVRLGERVGRPLDECVFVDDSAANVAAATAAGLDAILFTEDAPLRPQLRARGLPV